MKHAVLNEKLFNTLIESAVEHDFLNEIDSIDWNSKTEHIFSSTHMTKIRELLRAQRASYHWHSFLKTVSKVAVVILILLAVSFAGLMSVEAVRQEVFQIVVEWYEKYVDIFFERNHKAASIRPNESEEGGWMIPSYLPAGYEQSSIQRGRTALFITYLNEEGLKLSYGQTLQSVQDSLSLDREAYTLQPVEINEWQGMLFTPEDGVKAASLIWEDGRYVYQLSGVLDQEEILKIAESLLSEN